MRLTEKQAMVLLDLAKHSLQVCGRVAGYDEETRLRIVNEIVNQQSDDLVDLNQFSGLEPAAMSELASGAAVTTNGEGGLQ